jgi:3-oxoacyl-[acyl-carrier protein] reductase
MIEKKNGKIINLSSYAAAGGMIGNINYAASKGGINAITVTAAKELAKYGISVNAVAPGTIMTEMTSYLDSNSKLKEYYLSLVPMHRFGEPEEVASVVLFLASDQASYMTGQIITVSGGK